MTPRVDIVVPLYDKAAVVARTLESAQAQTMADWRMIVVDDGSTDGGAEIVARFAAADPRISMVRQANAGPGAARNAGFARGAAPLVAFLDADDAWTPAFLETATAALAATPSAAAFLSSWFWGEAREDRSLTHRAQGVSEGLWRCPPDIAPPALKVAVDFCHSSAAVARREAVAALGGYYDRHRCTYGEDSYLWLQLLLAHPVHRSVAPLMVFGVSESRLGHGRRTPYPAPPVLANRRRLAQAAPASHRETFGRYVDWYALFVANRMIRQGAPWAARRVLATQAPQAASPGGAWRLARRLASSFTRRPGHPPMADDGLSAG